MKKIILLIFVFLGFVSVLNFYVGSTRADVKIFNDENLGKVLYAPSDRKIFLSPNRKYLAVTTKADESDVYTYITDLNGNVITEKKLGSFSAWSPDSQKVLLYLAIEATGNERQMYFLGMDGEYKNMGLPPGVISADISAVDGSIVYAITDSKTDDTDLYLRNKKGEDQLVLKGEGNIIAYPRWSPSGDRLSFLKSDLAGRPGNQTIWIVLSDGSKMEKVSTVQWNHPPVWSLDGSTAVFADQGDIWKFGVQQNELKNLTNKRTKSAMHPSYANDEVTILFSDGEQIWSVKEGNVEQVTDDGGIKGYPISLVYEK